MQMALTIVMAEHSISSEDESLIASPTPGAAFDSSIRCQAIDIGIGERLRWGY
jgi:hypothetical protein